VKVVVTRAPEQAGELGRRLEALGHEVVLCPLVRIEPLGDEPIDLAGYDWVVVTSPNGARELARRRRGPLPRVAAIGPGTAAALRGRGIEPDLVPRRSTQEGLLAELPGAPGRVLVAAAQGARRDLPEALGADFLPLYATRELRPVEPPDGDLVLLASASAARALGALESRLPAVSIGPETTRAARAAGVHVVGEAKTHDLDGLVAAVEKVARAGTPPAWSSPS
jgi:uroporphyrinogen III methyltransferase/synthase